jgi:hypothetical protein
MSKIKRAVLILGAAMSLAVVVPAAASASDWSATREEAEMWVINEWPNVTSVRCYGREFDTRRAGRVWYGWFSCATGFKTRKADRWFEVARVTPVSRHRFRYRMVKVIG